MEVQELVEQPQDISTQDGVTPDTAVSDDFDPSGLSDSTREAAGVKAPEPQPGKGEPAPTPTAYVPNHKYKVHDEEKEFDDFVKGAIKDATTEKKARELYEKAYGLDVIKPKLEKERERFREVETQHNTLVNTVREILTARDKGDLDHFFERVNLPPQKVAEWLMQKIQAQEQLKNLPPEMREVYNNHNVLQRQVEDLRKQLEGTQATAVDSAAQARSVELQGLMTAPDMKPLVEEYNTRAGSPDAFRKLVIRHGLAEFHASGRDLTPQEAVSDVIQMLGLKSQAPSQGAQPSGAAPNNTQRVVAAPKKTAIIPNVGTSSVSSVSAKPKSIADLRKLAASA